MIFEVWGYLPKLCVKSLMLSWYWYVWLKILYLSSFVGENVPDLEGTPVLSIGAFLPKSELRFMTV